jgi:hypothetical protein
MIYAWFLAKSRKAAFCENTRKNARHKRA